MFEITDYVVSPVAVNKGDFVFVLTAFHRHKPTHLLQYLLSVGEVVLQTFHRIRLQNRGIAGCLRYM
jgi:hypothetical protein